MTKAAPLSSKTGPVNATDAGFNDMLERAGTRPVLVDFWADWCMPCRMMAPVLDDVARTLGDDVVIAKLDTERHPGVPRALGIRALPTLVLFQNKRVVDVFVGMRSKPDLVRALKGYVEKAKKAAA
jgi:thioredoxin 1